MPDNNSAKLLHRIYPTVFNFLSESTIQHILENLTGDFSWNDFPMFLKTLAPKLGLEDFIVELSQAEAAIFEAEKAKIPCPNHESDFPILNPSVEIIQTDWQLEDIIGMHGQEPPLRQRGFLIIWKHPHTLEVFCEKANQEELLCAKMAVENLSVELVAQENQTTQLEIQQALLRCCRKGILIPPASKLTRNPKTLPPQSADCFNATADSFTLQWYVTSECELNGARCSQPLQPQEVSIEQASKVLADLWDFCLKRHVDGHICFSGGNPFLHPQFMDIYQLASKQGFSTSLQATPVSSQQLEQMIKIQQPSCFQVRIEGLEKHDNQINGKNHFSQTIKFLNLLDEMDISSAVVLTLTKDNMGQILELADFLQDKTDYFTFRRLSPISQGTNLNLPEKEEFYNFVKHYVCASEKNPTMEYRDNLINIELSRRGWQLFDGCTGFGCGAAFNFIALLSDGQAHACQHFPSPIGNIYQSTIAQIYDSSQAEKYRAGSRACLKCRFKPVCGGCMACVSAQGRDELTEKDPFCFKEKLEPE